MTDTTVEPQDPQFVEWRGERYQIAEAVGIMPLLSFAKEADKGVEANDLAGLVAMYDALEQCLQPDDWKRFQKHATRIRADGEAVMDLVALTIEALAERPTSRPSDSSDGPSSTSARSTDDSSLRVIDRELEAGRPDRAYAVWSSQQQQRAALRAV